MREQVRLEANKSHEFADLSGVKFSGVDLNHGPLRSSCHIADGILTRSGEQEEVYYVIPMCCIWC
jgi:hypothetical protein